jgi:hypothetical protein
MITKYKDIFSHIHIGKILSIINLSLPQKYSRPSLKCYKEKQKILTKKDTTGIQSRKNRKGGLDKSSETGWA